MSSTVTVEKTYFETLLRKAQFVIRNPSTKLKTPQADLAKHSSVSDTAHPGVDPVVTILKVEYDSLLVAAREYANLRNNLFRGGINEDTLNILVKDESTQDSFQDTSVDWADETRDEEAVGFRPYPYWRHTATPSPNHIQSGAVGYTNGHSKGIFKPKNENFSGNHNHKRSHDQPTPESELADIAEVGDGFYKDGVEVEVTTKNQAPQYEKHAQRSMSITNLPEGCTHADITAAVKGGALLDIHLRPHDRVANVSFLLAAAAQDFLKHAKRYDLYVKGKRVNVRWAERQFILPGHVAYKIARGASRNLVIVNRTARHTEESIKNDLEHIHNLVVVKVSFGEKNAYISTNSVHNAIFAQTCMMSRSAYKASKIEWGVDECDIPLEIPLQARRENISVKNKEVKVTNRFHLLELDATDDDSEMDSSTSNGVSLPVVVPISASGLVL